MVRFRLRLLFFIITAVAVVSFMPLFYIDVDDRWCLVLPYWIPTTLLGFAAAITAFPRHNWLRWRFSLRALLIGMTVVAVLLGLVLWR
jgi:hypothetical protein